SLPDLGGARLGIAPPPQPPGEAAAGDGGEAGSAAAGTIGGEERDQELVASGGGERRRDDRGARPRWVRARYDRTGKPGGSRRARRLEQSHEDERDDEAHAGAE